MTTPFSDDLITKLKLATAWRFDGEIGEEVFTPRFFCCTDPNEMGLDPGKDPVAVIQLSPNPAFPGESVSFDGTESHDPDGSVASYAWTFEGQSPASSTASNGTITAGAVGVYTVQLVVTDGTGLKSAPARTKLVIAEREDLLAFFAATQTGLFATEDGGLTWQDRNAGLDGDQIIAYDVAVDPASRTWPLASQVVWRGGLGSILVSNDGGETWAEKNPASASNQWGDAPAPTVDEIAFRALLFADGKLFTAGTWQNGDGDYRSWIWYTEDFAKMRTDSDETVTWTQVSTGWDA